MTDGRPGKDKTVDANGVALQERVRRLKRWLRIAVAAWILTLSMLGVGTCAAPDLREDAILRARGLIIVDQAGRPRMALGAPIPEIEGRKRFDMPLGGSLGEHLRANGLVILDEDGMDRVVIGSPKPHPAIRGTVWRRISPSTGLQFNDEEGTERGGFGMLDNGNVGLGLDYVGSEAVYLGVRPDGRATIGINDPRRRQRILLGFSAEGRGALEFLDTSRAPRLRLELAADGSPALDVLDAEGRPLFEAPRRR
jgi:hypothetical protein